MVSWLDYGLFEKHFKTHILFEMLVRSPEENFGPNIKVRCVVIVAQIWSVLCEAVMSRHKLVYLGDPNPKEHLIFYLI